MPVLSRVRTRLSDLVASLDATAARLAHVTLALVLWPLLYAVCLGSTAFVARHPTVVALFDTNKVPTDDTYKMIRWVAVTLAAIAFLYGIAVPVARFRARRRSALPPTGSAVVAGLNRRLRPLLALPVMPALMVTAVERDSPKVTFFLVTIAAAVAGASAYAWLRAEPPLGATLGPLGDDAPPPRRPERAARLLAGVAVAALWAGYGWFFSRLAVINHHALNTRTIDLGIYDNIFYQSAHGHPLACSFVKAGYHGSAHFDPILVVLSPLYLLYPRAEFLLVLQAVWLGAGVVPVYLLARGRLVGRLGAVALAAMYALYPALHGANMYEFHSLTLVVPLMLWLLYFLESGRFKSYWLLLLPALLVREDVAILMCFVGLYAILSRRPRWTRLGWITILVSCVYFVVVKRFFMTSADVFNSGNKDAYSFAYYYDDLIPNHNGVGGMLISLLTNPVFVLKTTLGEPKILYLLTLFVPVVFLPFVARPGRVMLIWGLFFCLLASRGAVFSVHFQYSAIIIPIVFAVTPAALARVEDGGLVRVAGLDGARLRRSLLFAAFVASLLVSWKFGGLLENTTFRGGFTPPARALGPQGDRDLRLDPRAGRQAPHRRQRGPDPAHRRARRQPPRRLLLPRAPGGRVALHRRGRAQARRPGQGQGHLQPRRPPRQVRHLPSEAVAMGIVVRDLRKSFGGARVVDGVSFSIPSGELVALLGPSGGGKSTVLRIIAGLEEPDSGAVELNGADATRARVQDRAVGFVFQHYALFRHMTVRQNVAFGLEVRRRPRAEIDAAVRELLDLIQLGTLGDRYPDELSGGQRQRVALARALAPRPSLLLLDEPFGALDAKVRVELREWIRRLHHERRITSVFVTHDQDEAMDLADRVIVLHRGRVEQIGTPEDIYDRPATEFVASFVGASNVLNGQVRGGRAAAGALDLGAPTSAGDGAGVRAFVRPHDVELEPAAGHDGRHPHVPGGVASARIERMARVGFMIRLELRLADGQPLTVELTRDRVTEIGVVEGDRVFVNLRDAKIFVQDYAI